MPGTSVWRHRPSIARTEEIRELRAACMALIKPGTRTSSRDILVGSYGNLAGEQNVALHIPSLPKSTYKQIRLRIRLCRTERALSLILSRHSSCALHLAQADSGVLPQTTRVDIVVDHRATQLSTNMRSIHCHLIFGPAHLPPAVAWPCRAHTLRLQQRQPHV